MTVMLPPHAAPSALPPVYRDGYKRLLELRAASGSCARRIRHTATRQLSQTKLAGWPMLPSGSVAAIPSLG